MIRKKLFLHPIVCGLALLCSMGFVLADTFEWTNAVDGNFYVAGNWTNTTGAAPAPPNTGDTVLFNEAGTYIVSFSAGASSDELDVSTGDVTFQNTGGPFTYDITSGLGDTRVDGGNLTLGTSGAPLHLDTDVLRVRNGSQLDVLSGSEVDVASQLRVGAHSSGDGTIYVSGNGSTLTTSAANAAIIGSSGSTGTLTLNSGADANIGAALHIAASGVAGTAGTVNLNSASDMTVAGDLNMVTGTQSNQIGALNVTGTIADFFVDGNVNVGTGSATNQSATITLANGSSRFTQNGATDFTVGSSIIGNTALIDIDLGILSTGTGQVAINDSGTVSLTGGTFNANGPLTMTSGSEITIDGGDLNAAAGLDNSTGGTLDHLDGRLNVTGGAFVPGGFAYTIDGGSPSSFPHLVIGAGSNLVRPFDDGIDIGDDNNGTLTLENGGTVTMNYTDVRIGVSPGSIGELNVVGVGSSLTDSNSDYFGNVYVGSRGQGTLNIRDGGLVDMNNLRIAASAGSNGVATVDGSGSTLRNDNNLSVGGFSSPTGGTGELIVQNLSLVDVGNRLKIFGGGTVTLDGGSIVTNTLENIDGGTFDFIAGSLTIHSDIGIGTGTAFLRSVTLDSDQLLITPGTTTIAPFRSITLNGGTLETNDLVINGTLDFNNGTLRVTGTGGLTVGAAGPFGTSLSIGAGQTLDVTNTFTLDAGSTLFLSGNGNISANLFSSSGRLSGSGSIAGSLTNNAGGEVQGLAGNNLILTGGGNTNDGQVTLSGGQVHFTQEFTNSAAGLVVGNGTLRADGDTTNDGDMAFSAIANVIGDVANSAGGTIISAGGTTTFFDDVVNNGEIRTNENSFIVYFGSYSGNGDTGTGTVIMEGDLKPGSSPGTMTFGGDLSFGPAAGLEIEIGGLLAGSEYDQVTVADSTSLGGTLEVSLIDSFNPSPGQSYEIIDVNGSSSGTFSGLAEGSLVDNFGGTNLLITYAGGDGNDVTLLAAMPGDFDIDGDVDGADFTKWQRGESPNPLSQSDLADWEANYGTTAPLTATSTAVPEPATGIMLLLGMMAMLTGGRTLVSKLIC